MACGNHAIVGISSLGYPAAAVAPRGEFRALLDSCRAVLLLWLARARERNALRGLDDRLLGDIGVNREGAKGEWRKPFWQAGRRG